MTRKSGRKSPQAEPERSLRCQTCGRAIAGFESVHYGSIKGGYRDLCNRCFNQEVAAAGGIDFAHVQFEPLEMPDAAGQAHRFHFEIRLLGDRVALEAFELVDGAPGGYEFQVLGDAADDLFELMGQMVPRIRRALAQQHLKPEPHMPGLHIADFLVRGAHQLGRPGGWPAADARDRRQGDFLGALRANDDGFRGLAVQVGNPGSERRDLMAQG